MPTQQSILGFGQSEQPAQHPCTRVIKRMPIYATVTWQLHLPVTAVIEVSLDCDASRRDAGIGDWYFFDRTSEEAWLWNTSIIVMERFKWNGDKR